MSTWQYTNENGERVKVTSEQLKSLAKNGKITPTTIVKDKAGKSAPAGKVRGLTFVAATLPETVSSELSFDSTITPETYGLALPKPSAGVNPFTVETFIAPMPDINQTEPQTNTNKQQREIQSPTTNSQVQVSHEPLHLTIHYFYLDANNRKHGPVNNRQLQALASQGLITLATPLETDTGHKGGWQDRSPV